MQKLDLGPTDTIAGILAAYDRVIKASTDGSGRLTIEEAEKLRGVLEGKRLALEQNELVIEFNLFKIRFYCLDLSNCF